MFRACSNGGDVLLLLLDQIKLYLVRKNGTFSARETESTQMVQGQTGQLDLGIGKQLGLIRL